MWKKVKDFTHEQQVEICNKHSADGCKNCEAFLLYEISDKTTPCAFIRYRLGRIPEDFMIEVNKTK